MNNDMPVPCAQRLAGWAIHIFTASGAYMGLMALLAIMQEHYLIAFWWMAAAIAIDAVDGMFARFVRITHAVPKIDGALLDNIVDFFTYTMVPSFFILAAKIVPPSASYFAVAAITLASAYQFTQVDAKTSDHFFKGFPSYWNIAVFYLFFWQMQPVANLAIIMLLAVLSFVPIKYVYPSRLDYLTHNSGLKIAMGIATLVWGVATAGLLWVYPAPCVWLTSISMTYLVLYVAISLYRTWVPLGPSA